MNLHTIRPAAAGLLLMLAIAACGSGARPSGVSTLQSPGTRASDAAGPSASLDPEAAQLAFSRCMREHGVEVPDPVVVSGDASGPAFGAVPIGGPDVDPTKMQAALEACQSLLGQAGGTGGAPDPAQLDQMVKFAGCMREHGIDLPDPNSDGNLTYGNASGAPAGGNMDPSSPEFQAASEACRSFLPGGISGPGGASEAPASGQP